MNLKSRILRVVDFSGLSVSSFERKVGFSNGYVNSVKDNVRTDKIDKIISTYPMISRDWLVTGEGDMLTKTTPSNGETINNSIQSPIVHGTMENAYNGMSGIAGDENSIYVKLLEENRELRVTNAKLLKIIDNLTSKTP